MNDTTDITTTRKPMGKFTKGVCIIGAFVLVPLAFYGSATKDDSPAQKRSQVSSDDIRGFAAEATWEGMTISEQADLCAGLDLMGEDLTLQSINSGANDMDTARALLAVLKREC